MTSLTQLLGYVALVVLLAADVAFVRRALRRRRTFDPATCQHGTVDDGGVCLDCSAFVEGPAERVAVLVPATVRRLG